MSAAVLPDRYPNQALVYGSDAAYMQLVELLDRWMPRATPPLTTCSSVLTATRPPPCPKESGSSTNVRLTLGPCRGRTADAEAITAIGVAMWIGLAERQTDVLRNRRELLTTLTELNAIASAASIGFRNPASPKKNARPPGTPPTAANTGYTPPPPPGSAGYCRRRPRTDLANGPHGGARQLQRRRNLCQIVPH